MNEMNMQRLRTGLWVASFALVAFVALSFYLVGQLDQARAVLAESQSGAALAWSQLEQRDQQIATLEDRLIRARGNASWHASEHALIRARLAEAQTERRRVEHYFQTKYRLPPAQARTLAGYFQDAMDRAEERYGVALDLSVLAALTYTESRFNPRAVSSAGAVGIMQVMPRYHVHRYEFLEGRADLFVPRLNIRAGVFIFAEGLQRYGSVRKAIRAYHGGYRGVINPRPSTVAYEHVIFARLSQLRV